MLGLTSQGPVQSLANKPSGLLEGSVRHSLLSVMARLLFSVSTQTAGTLPCVQGCVGAPSPRGTADSHSSGSTALSLGHLGVTSELTYFASKETEGRVGEGPVQDAVGKVHVGFRPPDPRARAACVLCTRGPAGLSRTLCHLTRAGPERYRNHFLVNQWDANRGVTALVAEHQL